jgi:hypothetical protein
VALVLLLADGEEWRVDFSAGIERFIGQSPLLGGIMSDGPEFDFEVVEPAPARAPAGRSR